MSATSEGMDANQGWTAADARSRRWRQIRGILRLESGKNLFSRRSFALYLLAFGPVILAALRVVFAAAFGKLDASISDSVQIFAQTFDTYLRVSIYFSALYLFMNLFRAEIQERSLHYYFLSPVRREVLMAGKYLSGMIAICATFIVSTVLLFVLIPLPAGAGETMRFLASGQGLEHLVRYLAAAVLACAGYGAVFLLVGLVFRNPVVPGVGIWLWEWGNFILPPLLKKISVIFYVQSLYPVPPPLKLFSVLADPVPVWKAVLGVLLLTALALALAGLKARRMEVSYGGD